METVSFSGRYTNRRYSVVDLIIYNEPKEKEYEKKFRFDWKGALKDLKVGC